MSVTIEAVIFDYGGVLSTPPFVGVSEFERDHGYPKGSLLQLIFGGAPPTGAQRDAIANGDATAAAWAVYDGEDGAVPDWHLLETGRMTLAEFSERLVARSEAHLGSPIDAGFYPRFLESLRVGVYWPVVHRVRRLRAEGYRTAILTNNVAEWAEVWKASIPVELFDVVIDSSEVGLRKPDEAIFRLTCERLGVAPEAAVFLDDSPGHVAAARRAGLAGILVTGPDQALADLDDLLGAGAGQRA
ncbi:MAG TPA: HAD family phosphatase [Acidimicrobiia bacterium]